MNQEAHARGFQALAERSPGGYSAFGTGLALPGRFKSLAVSLADLFVHLTTNALS